MVAIHITNVLPLPKLTPDTVHVLSQSLSTLSETFTQKLITMLVPDELARAQRFIRPEDQRRFLQVRGLLRLALGSYLNLEPREICFDYGPHGQPRIQHRIEHDTLHFNVSHSHHHALFVFSLKRRIGVDVEWRRPLNNMQKMQRHICTVQEYEQLQRLDSDDESERFFQLWTRKEALLKAVGLGLHGGLRTYHIGWGPATRDQPLICQGPEDKPWHIVDLACGPDHSAALAIESTLLPN